MGNIINATTPIDEISPKTPSNAWIWFAGTLIAIGPLSLDAYLPAMPAMALSFGVPIVELNKTISVYLIGYGISQFFGGAFADQIGRKRIGLIGLSVFCLASILITFATTIDQVKWFRFIQALGGGFSTVICMAIVRDVYPREQLGKRMAMMTLIMLASPIIAPAVGALLLQFGWQSIFIGKAIYAAVLLVVYLLFVPETQPGTWRQLSLLSTFTQCYEVITRRVDGKNLPLRYTVSMALSAGVFMTFLTNSSFVYIEYFGAAETMFPLYFSSSLVGLILTNIYSINRLTPEGAAKQYRLGLIIQLVSTAALLVIALQKPTNIWMIVVPVGLIVSCFGLTGPAGSSQYMGFFEKLAGSASSFYTTLMFAMGALFGAISSFFFDGSLTPMVLTMIGAAVAANLIGLSIPRHSR